MLLNEEKETLSEGYKSRVNVGCCKENNSHFKGFSIFTLKNIDVVSVVWIINTKLNGSIISFKRNIKPTQAIHKSTITINNSLPLPPQKQ